MYPQYTLPVVEFGFCHCGCGEKTRISRHDYPSKGWIKGQPLKFINGHNSRLQKLVRTEKSFWDNISILGDDNCWLWQKATDACGYGTVSFRGQKYRAHRLAWILTNGEPGDGVLVLHTCDNPPCCNVGHLFLGTQTDNMQDMMRKGRGNKPKGGEHSMARLSEDDILAIIKLYESGEMSYPVIADLYNVSQSNIGNIVRRETWKHVKQK